MTITIGKAATFNRMLGNPAKKHYNLVVTKSKQIKDKCMKFTVNGGGTATLNYNDVHAEG